MERRPEQVLGYMAELEEVAEDLLAERRQVIDLDARRQKTREAMRLVGAWRQFLSKSGGTGVVAAGFAFPSLLL